MRKRKKPILLVTILVCAFGALVAMTYTPPPPTPGAPQPPETGKEVETKSKEDLAANVKNLVKNAPKPSPSKPPMSQGDEPGPPLATGPIGLKPEVKPYKPVFNDSATSTQWYTDKTPQQSPTASTPAPSTKKVRPHK